MRVWVAELGSTGFESPRPAKVCFYFGLILVHLAVSQSVAIARFESLNGTMFNQNNNNMETLKNLFAYVGIGFLMLGGCLADSESLIPTILFVTLGGIFVGFHKHIERLQEKGR